KVRTASEGVGRKERSIVARASPLGSGDDAHPDRHRHGRDLHPYPQPRAAVLLLRGGGRLGRGGAVRVHARVSESTERIGPPSCAPIQVTLPSIYARFLSSRNATESIAASTSGAAR